MANAAPLPRMRMLCICCDFHNSCVTQMQSPYLLYNVYMQRRFVRGAIGMAVFAGGLYLYSIVQRMAGPAFLLDNSIDAAIPFVPWMILVYLSYFPFVVVTVFFAEQKEFFRILLASLIAMLIAFTFFLVFPIGLSRPDPNLVPSNFLRQLYEGLHSVDAVNNTFPSMHVCVTWICCSLFFNRSYRRIVVLPAAAISASTLFAKQHLLVDVAGGMLLAYLCTRLSRLFLPDPAKEKNRGS